MFHIHSRLEISSRGAFSPSKWHSRIWFCSVAKWIYMTKLWFFILTFSSFQKEILKKKEVFRFNSNDELSCLKWISICSWRKTAKLFVRLKEQKANTGALWGRTERNWKLLEKSSFSRVFCSTCMFYEIVARKSTFQIVCYRTRKILHEKVFKLCFCCLVMHIRAL